MTQMNADKKAAKLTTYMIFFEKFGLCYMFIQQHSFIQ